MSDRSAPSPLPAATTRRTVLRAAGLAALTGGGVAALGACAADGDTGSAPSSATSASSAPASSSAPAASSSATPSASKSVAVPSGPSVATSEVPVGGGVILDDADYVITQPTAGDFKAFSKICTHQRCPVTSVKDGAITCPCHNSKFSISDGSPTSGPANRALPEAKITVAGDQVVVTA